MYKRIENDKNAQRDFYKAMSAWGYGITAPRSVAYYHHTATTFVYVAVKDNRAINYYNGKYGAGFVEYVRDYKCPHLFRKNYYIFREDYKAYEK